MMSKQSRPEAVSGGTDSEGSTQKGNMSSPINPTHGSNSPAPVDLAAAAKAAAPSAGRDVQSVQASASLEAPVSVDTTPSSPPPEVLSQIAEAAGTYERLAAAGQEVRFAADESTGRATAQLVDEQGNVIRQLSPGEAIAIALGESNVQPGDPA